MSLEKNNFYEFANFRIDLREKVLTRDDKPLSLTPKAFHLLQILVENHGHIVDKDRLMGEIWSDSFVEEGNLAFNARMLRKALGDDASHPKFIETIPRRGYRFVAEVRQNGEVDQVELPAFPPRRNTGSYLRIAGVCLLIVGSIGAAGWFFRSSLFTSGSVPILATQFKSEKFTTSGNVQVAAISTNGEYAAYIDAVGQKQSVWLRRLDTEESIQIVPPGDDYYSAIRFSNDGNSLFFSRKPYEGHAPPALYRVSAFGGIPVKIVDGVTGSLGVSPTDRQISFVRCNYVPDDFCSLFVADTDGKNERKMITRPAPLHIEDNRFSPDGRSIAFTSGNSANGASDQRLFLIDVASGKEREIASRTFFDVKSLDWLPNGEGLIFSAKEFLDGKVSLWKLSLADGECTRLSDDPNSYLVLSLTKAADKMVATQVTNNYRLVISTEKGERSLATARDFSFAPNGKIVYASEDRNIWEINFDGSGQRQLTSDPATDFSPRVSPDNKYIFFTSNRTGTNHVWRMDADGANQIQVTKNEGGYPRLVSSDGRWVFYLSGKTDQLWKVSAETGEEIRLSDKKFFSPQISPDGQFIAYFTHDKVFKIGVMRIADQQVVRTLDYGDGTSRTFVLSWMPDSRTLYFVSDKDERNLLWQQSIDEASPRFIAELGPDDVARLSPTPDGKGIAYTRGKWIHNAVLISGLK